MVSSSNSCRAIVPTKVYLDVDAAILTIDTPNSILRPTTVYSNFIRYCARILCDSRFTYSNIYYSILFRRTITALNLCVLYITMALFRPSAAVQTTVLFHYAMREAELYLTSLLRLCSCTFYSGLTSASFISSHTGNSW